MVTHPLTPKLPRHGFRQKVKFQKYKLPEKQGCVNCVLNRVKLVAKMPDLVAELSVAGPLCPCQSAR
jgi:hypothetical protein